jgi:hypothetical protein
MLMDNVVLDGGPGQGYRSLLSGGDNSQLEDLKVSSQLKESASKVRQWSFNVSAAKDREFS